MALEQVQVENFAQIRRADLTFGDLTVLVGPQATGKSLLLQLFKLVVDRAPIVRTIRRYGFDWNGDPARFFALYFGGGMEQAWREGETRLSVKGHEYSAQQLASPRSKQKAERFFLIPAQRVLTLRDGWPRDYMSYGAGDPFVVRQFSEHLRQLMEAGLGRGAGPIFPKPGRMAAPLRRCIAESVFAGAEVRLEMNERDSRKTVVLQLGEEKTRLGYMTWSAGQREFLPLLLGLYWLMPSSHVSKKGDVEWVAIEEPEMGLHPEAISAFLLAVLELLRRGYRVIITTHSPQLLELVWAIQILREKPDFEKSLAQIFEVKRSNFVKELAWDVRTKSLNTFFFRRGADGFVTTKNISSLDAAAEDPDVSDWGGLTHFSTRLTDVVADRMAGAA